MASASAPLEVRDRWNLGRRKTGRGHFPRTTKGHFGDDCEGSGERVSRTETQAECL